MLHAQEPNEKKAQNNAGNYAKYSSLAFQMLGIIAVFTYGGVKADEWLENKTPVFTLVLSLISIAASLYIFIRGSIQK